MKWFRHAFAVDDPGPAEPTPAQQPAIDWVCTQIARRKLTTPGLMFLEMTKPMNYVSAQAMHFFRPGIWAMAGPQTYEGYVQFAEFLEHRGSTEYIARRVEHFEAEFARLEREGKSIREFIDAHMQQLVSAAEQVRDQTA